MVKSAMPSRKKSIAPRLHSQSRTHTHAYARTHTRTHPHTSYLRSVLGQVGDAEPEKVDSAEAVALAGAAAEVKPLGQRQRGNEEGDHLKGQTVVGWRERGGGERVGGGRGKGRRW